MIIMEFVAGALIARLLAMVLVRFTTEFMEQSTMMVGMMSRVGAGSSLVEGVKLLVLTFFGDFFKVEAVGNFRQICRLGLSPTSAVRVVWIRNGSGRTW